MGKARWHFGQVSNRPKVHFVATVGAGRAQRTMQWERVSWIADAGSRRDSVRVAAGLVEGAEPGGGSAQAADPVTYRATSVEPLMMAGDLTQDGYVPIERADGTTEQVFVKASATYRATGLVPGERVTVRLGTNRAPNLTPLAHYTGESIVDGVVPDATGAHDAQASGGVTLVEPGQRGQAFSLDGNGAITVPHDPEFEFGGGFMVQAAVRPPPAGGPDASVLVEKEGQLRLELVRVSGELRARFAVETAAGEESVTSVVPVLAGEWSLVTGRYESGRLWVGVDTEASRSDDFTHLSAAPVHSASDIRIGPAFKGEIDEIRIFDLTKAPLSTFANGQTSVSFVADATGTFEMPIVSTGRLARDSRTAQYRQALAREALAQGDEEPPPTTLQAGLGSELIEAETFWEDTAERSTTWYGYCSAALMGSMVKIARGILVGSEPGETDLAVMAGDIAGSLFLSPVAILRDMANSTERLIHAQPSGDDALNLALGLVTIAGALTKGKLGAFLQIPKLVKSLPAGSRASSTMARLVALEAKLAAGAAGASRAEKLIQVAQVSSTASQMVGGVLDAVGVHIDAIEAFNRIMSNAEVQSDQGSADMLSELDAARQAVPGQSFPMVVLGLGSEYELEDEPSADTGVVRRALTLLPQHVRSSSFATLGLLRAHGVDQAGPKFVALVRNFKGTTRDVKRLQRALDDLNEARKRLDASDLGGLDRVLTQMAGGNKARLPRPTVSLDT